MTPDLLPPTSDIRPLSSGEDVLVSVCGVKKKFCRSLKKSLWYGVKDMVAELVGGKGNHDILRDGEFWAVNNVSFELRRGECLGLIGRNGAGKTTLLKMLNGLIKPDSGSITMRGRVGALIALGAGFNPILTGRENVYVNGSVLGLTKREIDEKMEDIINFAEIRDFIDSPVQSYSSGMQVRLGFAVATALDPDILLVDEVLAVGDFRFRWKCLQRIKKLKDKGVCIILVSHNSGDQMRTCSRGYVLERGESKFDGGITESILGYETNFSSYDQAPQLPSNVDPSLKIAIKHIQFSLNGARKTIMEGAGAVDIEVEVYSSHDLDKIRVVISLVSAEYGALFHISSYIDHQWIRLKRGRNSIALHLETLPVQFGSYYAEATIRGPELSDIYGYMRSVNPLIVKNPVPDYEGFGINGVLLPSRKWILG